MQIGYQIVGTALEGMGGSAVCGARVSMCLCAALTLMDGG